MEQEHFLIVPFGLLYSEVAASSLVSEKFKKILNVLLIEPVGTSVCHI